MTWSAMPTFTDGSVLTGSQLNILVANLNESAAAKASAAGQIFVSTGVNALAARTPTASLSVVSGVDTTTSTSYTTSLTSTSGPSVTVTTGTKAIVFVASSCRCGTPGVAAHASFAVSSATTLAAADEYGVYHMASTANYSSRLGAATVLTTLTAGSNIFTMAYKSGAAGTSGFDSRQIIVLPIS